MLSMFGACVGSNFAGCPSVVLMVLDALRRLFRSCGLKHVFRNYRWACGRTSTEGKT